MLEGGLWEREWGKLSPRGSYFGKLDGIWGGGGTTCVFFMGGGIVGGATTFYWGVPKEGLFSDPTLPGNYGG